MISLAIIAFGYGLYSLVLPNRAQQLPKPSDEEWPGVSFVIPAYNEEQFLAKKIENTLRSIYPKEKLEIIIAADGSTDNSQKVCADFPVRFENNGERAGKSAAMNRAAAYAKHEILIFSDANALLNPEAIREIVRPLLLPQYAMSSGEKKVIKKEEGENASEGEGLYWKYESFLKQKDSNFYTLLGAVGELFGMKKSHFVEIPKNFLVDDFYEAACILQQGYQIRYVPEAVATEYGSLNFKEEIKRKIRISAGGYQSIFHFKSLFNPLKN
ncbi:MAG: glycosyltransferase, partial [Luteibaculum sp.]